LDFVLPKTTIFERIKLQRYFASVLMTTIRTAYRLFAGRTLDQSIETLEEIEEYYN